MDPSTNRSPRDEVNQLRADFARLFDELHACARRLNALEARLQPESGNSVPAQTAPPPVSEADSQQPLCQPAPLSSPTVPDQESQASDATHGQPGVATPVAAEANAESPAIQPAAASVSSPDEAKRPADKTSQTGSFEAMLGGNWLNRIGIGILILAIAFLGQWAWLTLDTPAWLRVLAFHLLGGVFVAGGVFYHFRKLPVFSQGLAGLGIFTLFAAAYMSIHLYEFPARLMSRFSSSMRLSFSLIEATSRPIVVSAS